MKIEEFLQICLRNLTEEAVTRSKKKKRKRKQRMFHHPAEMGTREVLLKRYQNAERSSAMALDVAWRVSSVWVVLRNPASNWEGAT